MAEWNKEIQTKIIAHAWKDEEFHNLLINNPKEALKQYGVEIPGNIEFKVWNEDANHRYFVMPQAPTEARKLSEEELEKMAAARIEGCCSIPGPTNS